MKFAYISGALLVLSGCSSRMKTGESIPPEISSSISASSRQADDIYSSDIFGFSMQRPLNWEMYEELPGGRSSEVYAADLYINFYPPTGSSSAEYRIFKGFDIQVYKGESLEGFLNQEVIVDLGSGEKKSLKEILPSFKKTTVNGLLAIKYDGLTADMIGQQKIRTIIVQVGSNVLQIRVDRSEASWLAQYISTLKKIP